MFLCLSGAGKSHASMVSLHPQHTCEEKIHPSAWKKHPSKKNLNIILQHKPPYIPAIKSLILALLSCSSLQTRFPSCCPSTVSIRLLCKRWYNDAPSDSGLFPKQEQCTSASTSISQEPPSQSTTCLLSLDSKKLSTDEK